jgi:hypothetical protein
MSELTGRRDPEARHECWRVFYRDIQVGTIGERSGVPNGVDVRLLSSRQLPHPVSRRFRTDV